ncbi:hypothetical protein MFRU_002g01430 [Monilinia fructicola]|nr:hypothetical protein MFRU_002g01430 [Monilinia fructicola]
MRVFIWVLAVSAVYFCKTLNSVGIEKLELHKDNVLLVQISFVWSGSQNDEVVRILKASMMLLYRRFPGEV